MPKATPITTTTAEWLLARFVGPTRAVAIMGDLTEMAVSRGRIWLWAAYGRTLISVGWRTPVAFLIAVLGVWLDFRGVLFIRLLLWLRHVTFGLFGRYNLPVINMPVLPLRTEIAYRIVSVENPLLFFALPFALVRFGWRSRLTQLTFALALGLMAYIAVPIYSLRPMLMDLTVLFAIVTALALPQWRRPMIVLAAAYLVSIAPGYACWFILRLVHGKEAAWFLYRVGLGFYYVGLALEAIVCVLLHRWMQERPELSGPAELAGGADAQV